MTVKVLSCTESNLRVGVMYVHAGVYVCVKVSDCIRVLKSVCVCVCVCVWNDVLIIYLLIHFTLLCDNSTQKGKYFVYCDQVR